MTATATPTGEARRERRRQRMAAEIELAALRLFAERGFEHVTIDEIAEAVDISRRTFFRYYAGKEEVLLRDGQLRAEEVRESLERQPPGVPAIDALRNAILEVVGSLEADPEVTRLRAQVAASAPDVMARGIGYHMAMTASVTRLIALRMGVDPAADLRPGVIVAAASSAVQVATRMWMTDGATSDLPALVVRALDLVEGGLRAAAEG